MLKSKILEVRYWSACERCWNNEIVNTFRILNYTNLLAALGLQRMTDFACQANVANFWILLVQDICQQQLPLLLSLDVLQNQDCHCIFRTLNRQRSRRNGRIVTPLEFSKLSHVVFFEMQAKFKTALGLVFSRFEETAQGSSQVECVGLKTGSVILLTDDNGDATVSSTRTHWIEVRLTSSQLFSDSCVVCRSKILCINRVWFAGFLTFWIQSIPNMSDSWWKEHQSLLWHFLLSCFSCKFCFSLSKSFNFWSCGWRSNSRSIKHCSILLCLLNQSCHVLMLSSVFLTLLLRNVFLV